MNIKETVSRVFGKSGDSEEQSALDALELIRSDHREVDALFAKALGDDTPAAQRRRAIAQIVEALTVHARMEEVLFYPALRKAGGKDERDSVLEAAEEHGVVKDLIAKIERSQGRDETLTAKVTVLKELVHHHVQEEEGTIFDEARRVLGKDRLEKLGSEMQRFKERALRGQEAGRSAASGKKSTAKRSAAKKPAAKTPARKTATRKTAARKTSAKRKTR